MNRKNWILIVLIISSLMTSCSQPGKIETEKCIVGEWLLISDEAYARALLPPGSFEQDTLKYNSGGGLVLYTFDDKDQLTIQVSGWLAQFSVMVENILYQLDFQMMGEAIGEYSLDENLVQVDSQKSSQLNLVASFDGETMLATDQAREFAPLFLSGYNKAQFECTDSTLSLNLLDQPGINQPIIFQRVIREQK